MAKRYARINYVNSPATTTPLNATNLNKMDKGIDDCDNAIEALNDNLVLVLGNINLASGISMVASRTTLRKSGKAVYLSFVVYKTNLTVFNGRTTLFIIADTALRPDVIVQGIINGSASRDGILNRNASIYITPDGTVTLDPLTTDCIDICGSIMFMVN